MNKDKIQVGDLVADLSERNLGVGLVIGVKYWPTSNLAYHRGLDTVLVDIYWLKKGSVGNRWASKLMKLSPTQENPK